jgi:thiol-disulfide isomerase/thioredoxin
VDDRTANTPIPTPENLDVYSDQEESSIELTPENFDEIVGRRDFVMVNFYAPWCHWSNRLKPVWEHTATFLKDNKRVLLGRVDCTTQANRPLCQRNHIMAFPTIRIFRLGQTHSQEFYDGDRQTSAFLEFVGKELSQLKGTIMRGENEDDDPLPPIRQEGHYKNLGKENFEDTSRGPEGCMLTGFVMVNRAPGNFHIQARSPEHSFNADNLNTTHFVSSLTFGSPLSVRELATLNKDTAPYVNTLENELFVSRNFGVTREHYVKVVHTTVHKLGAKSSLSTYQYTTTDTEYVEHPPSAKFSFDLSPTQIVIRQTRQALSTFITSVCAIIGGVFTVIGLVDSVLYHSVNVLKKKQLGKLG